MVSSGLPQNITPAHAFKPAKDVLDGVVERMAHMQRARHIGWWNDYGVGLGLGLAPRLEKPPRLP